MSPIALAAQPFHTTCLHGWHRRWWLRIHGFAALWHCPHQDLIRSHQGSQGTPGVLHKRLRTTTGAGTWMVLRAPFDIASHHAFEDAKSWTNHSSCIIPKVLNKNQTSQSFQRSSADYARPGFNHQLPTLEPTAPELLALEQPSAQEKVSLFQRN